ncbi:class A beta-lactamase [Actinoalloteichus hymeniacidonis]|uniref:class A beta-lactamase n=1 Tax=Actinoalloteichus hymeniacidonis TaxID=340345 RepID=UPI00288AAAE5|nr:class A beta-lactamase [Actinoalloteichus hymeniacidonis]
MLGREVARRVLLIGGLSAVGATVLGCSATSESVSSPSGRSSSPVPSSVDTAAVEAELAALEAEFGGRLGVYAVDTGSGNSIGHRAQERFLLCSTAKVLAVAAVLRLRVTEPELMERVVQYDQSQVLEYAPVTAQHVADGMTVSALCDAAITVSDNTAMNLLMELVGGPDGVTDFCRSLGDEHTRVDRMEPELNVGAPGDERDTSTPEQMAVDLRELALGAGLDETGRELLVGWLRANTTGDEQIRAGLPADWQVGDKTGSGSLGEINDIAVVWPPEADPWVIAVYTAPDDPESTTGRATVAAATAIVAGALGATD